MRLPYEIVAETHLRKAEEYWRRDRLQEARAAMALALNVGMPASDVYDRQRTIDAELAARLAGARLRVGEHLWVEIPVTMTSVARNALLTATEAAWLEITTASGVRWGKPVLVTIFPEAETTVFLHARYGYYAERTEAHKVCLPPFSAPSGGAYRRAARHEIAHAALHDVLGEAVPRWFDEGAAVWLEGGSDSLERRQVRIAAAHGRLPTLAQIDAALGSYQTSLDSITAGVAYGAAGAFIGWVMAAHGSEALPTLLREARRRNALSKASRAVFGRDLRKLESDWRRTLAVGNQG